MIIKKVEVRAAAALTGSNVTTNAVNVRGAKMVAFMCSASNATTLSAALPQVSNDGTNWVDCSAVDTTPTNGKAGVLWTNTVAGIALNAGPANVVVVPWNTFNAYIGSVMAEAQLRLKCSTAGTVNDFTVTAFVYYDENTRIQVGEGFTPAL